MNNSKFRKNLRIVRNMKGYSPEELSKELKFTSRKRICLIEAGILKPTSHEIRCICVFLDVNIDDMLKKKATITIEMI